MQRDLEEVLASQATMLQRSGRPGGAADKIRSAFVKHLDHMQQWLPTQSHMQVLPLQFARAVAKPHEAAADVAKFLGRVLNLDAMAAAVDEKLYRNRSQSGGSS